MPSWKSAAGNVFWIALGLLILWGAWHTWGEFNQLESGRLEKMKIWAPVAWIYNLGGAWSVIAKWVAITGLALVGLGIAAAGVISFLPDKGETPLPAHELDPRRFDARYDLSVSKAQIALEETVEIQGPVGTFNMRLQKTLQDQDHLRFQNQGLEGKGDLYVVIQVRHLPG